MNKYLLKIAAARKSSPGSLHELEPGIKYDISKHSIKVDTKTKQEIENKYKKHERFFIYRNIYQK